MSNLLNFSNSQINHLNDNPNDHYIELRRLKDSIGTRFCIQKSNSRTVLSSTILVGGVVHIEDVGYLTPSQIRDIISIDYDKLLKLFDTEKEVTSIILHTEEILFLDVDMNIIVSTQKN